MIKFIAEIGSNHNGDLERALDLIEVAAHVGCAGVKFQLFQVDKLYHSSVFKNREYQFLLDRKSWELPVKWLLKLERKAHSLGLLFGCTPFHLDAIEILSQLDIDFYKISSYDILNHRLIEAIANQQKPVILSIGLASYNETTQALRILKESSQGLVQKSQGLLPNIYVLYCVSSYPASPRKMNLSHIDTYIPQSIINIGLSDHSANPGVIFRAIYYYHCSLIEFHLDLGDKKGFEYGSHCWLPQDIERVITWVQDGLIADGPQVENVNNEMRWRASPHDGLRPLESERNVI